MVASAALHKQGPSRVTAKIAMVLACMAVIKRNDGSLNVEAFAPSIPASTTTATVSSTAAVQTSDTVLATILTTADTAHESSRLPNGPSRHRRAVYDLGLGRNGPVYTPQSDSDLWNQYLVASSSSSDHGEIPIAVHDDNNVASATQYLVEHATTRNFPVPVPQPLRPKDATTIPTSAKPKRSHPPLIPHRITNDADLMIRPSSMSSTLEQQQQDSSAHTNAPQMLVPSAVSSATTATIPFVMTRSSSHHRSDFDVNTAWMELLIYEQQQKHNANPNQSVDSPPRPMQTVSSLPQQKHVSAKGVMALSAVHP